jgi:signal transduction histidine kinase
MEVKELKKNAKKDFDTTVCLMSIIPLLTFFYILVGKMASLEILAGEIGYIMLIVIAMILIGIFTGKKVLWDLVNRLIDSSDKIHKMEVELVEKSRLATITETALSLGHEINNPLLVIQGNITMMESDLKSPSIPESIKARLGLMKTHCDRIVDVMNKMAKLRKPVTDNITGNVRMIDLGKSK